MLETEVHLGSKGNSNPGRKIKVLYQLRTHNLFFAIPSKPGSPSSPKHDGVNSVLYKAAGA